MTAEPQVTHPEVTHPEKPAPAAPPAAAEKPEKPATGRPARRPLRVPPPKILAAAALVVVAVELLIWQVGGPFWGGVIHGALLFLLGVGLLVWVRWRNRRDARLARTVAGQAARFAGLGRAPGAGRDAARGRLGRLLRRGGGPGSRAAAGSGGGRRGLLSRLTGGRRGSAARSGGGRSGSGTGRTRGLLGRVGRSGATGRRTGSGTGRAGGRTGGILGRLGRRSATAGAGRSGGGTSGRRTGLRSALGRAGSGGRSLLSGARTAAGRAKRSTAAKPATRVSRLARGAVANFLRGVREGAQAKPQPKKPSPAPKPAAPAPAPAAAAEKKPQPPTRDELVKEAVEKVADAMPAPVTSRRSKGTTVGSMRDILAAAEDLAAQLKAYDEEDMHVFVRELPQLGEALGAVEGGIRMMASRAESEWPLAAPVVEALGSVAGDVRAAASTVGEAKTAVHRENETDIERGEAPRQGERRWNV